MIRKTQFRNKNTLKYIYEKQWRFIFSWNSKLIKGEKVIYAICQIEFEI